MMEKGPPSAYELRDKLREVLADYEQDDQLRPLVMAIAGIGASAEASDALREIAEEQAKKASEAVTSQEVERWIEEVERLVRERLAELKRPSGGPSPG